MVILSADIGGTNSRFAVFSANGGALSLLGSTWLQSKDVESFKILLEKVQQSSIANLLDKVESIVIAGAGPVEKGEVCSPPNIPWKIYKSDLNLQFPRASKYLINDFLAQAYSSISQCGNEAIVVKAGLKKEGAIGVIGAGTGLGKAYLNLVNGNYVGFPSEGGHAPFAPRNSAEFNFLEFLQNKVGRKQISWEDVSAGRSFSYLYEFLFKKELSPAEVSGLLKAGEADQVAEIYARIMGRICMAFALELLATGGIYIAGGVLAKNRTILENPAFLEAFLGSPTQKELLKDIPIYLIDNENSGLWGGAQYALSHISV